MAAANHLNRRQILKVAGALGAAGGFAALPAPEIGYAEPALPDAPGPAGSWIATVTIAGAGAPPPFQALRTYASGGGYVETSSNSHNPQAPDGPAHGAWVSSRAAVGEVDQPGNRARMFAVTFLAQRFDANGNMIGSIIVRESGTLDKTGDTYSGSGKFEIRDLQGNAIASGVATVQATRIKVEALL
jgi:TAT (twin-arginine translocation) pathway signal sequence